MIDLSIIKTMIQQDYAMQEVFDKIDELQAQQDQVVVSKWSRVTDKQRLEWLVSQVHKWSKRINVLWNQTDDHTIAWDLWVIWIEMMNCDVNKVYGEVIRQQ